MQWIFVLCGCMFLLSLIATYQVCTVSLKAGLYTYKGTGADRQQRPLRSRRWRRLTASVRWLKSAWACRILNEKKRRQRSNLEKQRHTGTLTP